MSLRQLAAAIGLVLVLNTAEAEERRFELKLKAQDLSSALKDLASEADVQIRYDAGEPSHGEKTAPALHGRYSLRQALDELLGGTELTYEVSPQGVVTINQRGSAFPLPALTVTASQIPGYCAYSGFAATKTDTPAPAPRRALRLGPDGPWLRCDRRQGES